MAGDLIKRPELADTLERLVRSSDPVYLFYRGDMAKTIVEEIQANGTFLFKLFICMASIKYVSIPF